MSNSVSSPVSREQLQLALKILSGRLTCPFDRDCKVLDLPSWKDGESGADRDDVLKRAEEIVMEFFTFVECWILEH